VLWNFNIFAAVVRCLVVLKLYGMVISLECWLNLAVGSECLERIWKSFYLSCILLP